jgi:hypothetical protein
MDSKTTLLDIPHGPLFIIFDFMFSAAVQEMIVDTYLSDFKELDSTTDDHIAIPLKISTDKYYDKKEFLTKNNLRSHISNLSAIFQTCKYFRNILLHHYSKINSFNKVETYRTDKFKNVSSNNSTKKFERPKNCIPSERHTFLAACKAWFFQPQIYFKNIISLSPQILIYDIANYPKTDENCVANFTGITSKVGDLDQTLFVLETSFSERNNLNSICIDDYFVDSKNKNEVKRIMEGERTSKISVELEKLRLPHNFIWDIKCVDCNLSIQILEEKQKEFYSSLEFAIFLDLNDETYHEDDENKFLENVQFGMLFPADSKNRNILINYDPDDDKIFIQIDSKKRMKNLINIGFIDVKNELFNSGKKHILTQIEIELKTRMKYVSIPEINMVLNELRSILIPAGINY